MKLPRATAGTVQRLTTPDIAQEAARAGINTGIAQTLVGAAGQAIHIFDQSRASREATNALRDANALQQFLSTPNINLNDPLVSDDTRRQVLANNDLFDATRVTVEGDKYMVPSEWVGVQMMEEFAKRIRQGADNLSGNQRVMYNDFIKDSVANTFEKIKLQIKKAEIDSTSRNYEDMQDQAIDQGLFQDALDIGDAAFGLNLWDEKKLKKRQKDVYAMGEKRLDMRLEALNNEMQAAVRDGERGTAEAIREQYVRELDEHETFGFVTREQYNEKIKEFDMAAEFEATRADAVRIYSEQGLGAVQKYIRERRQKIPEFYEGKDWTEDMNRIRSEINGYQEDANKLQTLMKANLEYDAAVNLINGALNNAHLLPLTPENRKAANLVYRNSRDAWYQLGMQGFIDQATNFILKTGIIPDDMEAEMNAAMMSKNPRAAQNVVQLYNRIKAGNAALLGQMDEKPAAFYTMLSRAARVFGEEDFEQAYNSTYEALFVTPDIVNQRRGEYVGSFKKRTMKKRMRDIREKFEEKYGGDIDITPEFEADYRNLERIGYMLTGDMKVAQEMATQRLLASYAPQRLNGRDLLIRNAPDPEKMPWAKPQLQNYIKSRWPQLVEKYGSESIQIISREAANQRLGEPAYGFRFINPENQWDRSELIDPQTGNQALWRPDFKQTQEYKDQQALKRRMANSAEYLQQKYDQALDFFKQQEAQKNQHYYDFGLRNQIDQINMDRARRLFLDAERIRGDDILYEKSKKALKEAQEDAQQKEDKQENNIRRQIEAAASEPRAKTNGPMTSRIPARDIL